MESDVISWFQLAFRYLVKLHTKPVSIFTDIVVFIAVCVWTLSIIRRVWIMLIIRVYTSNQIRCMWLVIWCKMCCILYCFSNNYIWLTRLLVHLYTKNSFNIINLIDHLTIKSIKTTFMVFIGRSLFTCQRILFDQKIIFKICIMKIYRSTLLYIEELNDYKLNYLGSNLRLQQTFLTCLSKIPTYITQVFRYKQNQLYKRCKFKVK